MDPTPANIAIFCFPTAICTRNPSTEDELPSDTPWFESFQNPKNRIDSLAAHHIPKWRLDGASTTGTRFFAIPNFAIRNTPIRVDTYIPDISQQQRYVRRILNSNSSMFVENSQVGDSSIGRHILRALEAWSESWGWAEFETAFMSMPFGSRIMIENIHENISRMDIQLVPYYAVEQQMLSASALQALWNLPQGAWPETLDLQNLQFVQQLHESIALVQLSSGDRGTYVFKSLTDDLKPFYHELKTLLTLTPHPNVIPRPSYIIIKKCHFGGKIGVCGFLLEEYPYGTLKNALSARRIRNDFRLEDKLHWAAQITSALIHINSSTKGAVYYTTLKPENIMLATSGTHNVLNAVLIDFEQRYGPPCLNPPEVNYPAYLIDLATNCTLFSMKQKYTSLLKSTNLLPAKTNTSTTARYSNPDHGACEPWDTLTPPQREAAQVFALGKLLWCIFEDGSLLNTAIGTHTFREDICDIEFPEFRKTPPGHLRELIKKCTSGAGEWRGRGLPLVRRGNMICVCGGNGNDSAEDVQVAARRWWREEIADAEKFVAARASGNHEDEEVWSWATERPKLSEVLRSLQEMLTVL
jgi:hypothetical protein